MVKLRDNNGEGGKAPKAERLASLDALRGSILLLIVSGGFGLKAMLPEDRWTWVTSQWSHREWAGCSLWDLLCPALLFVVGVAMTYSYANRQASGQRWFRQFVHALLRSTVLVALGCYLDSYRAAVEGGPARLEPRFTFDLRGELQQIGIAYLIAFLVLPLGMPVQGITVAFLLIGHTAAYVVHAAAAGQDLWSPSQVHVGAAIDHWLRFGPHPEKLTSFNAVPGAAIVLIGILVGGLIRSGLTPGAKVALMTGCGFVGIASGWALSGGGGWVDVSWFAVIPLVRPLATLTFVLTTVGWSFLLFTYFYMPIDGLMLRSWATPLALVGRNSLLVYVAYRLLHGWAETTARMLLPIGNTELARFQPLFVALIVMAIFWILCLLLYRRQIFVKV